MSADVFARYHHLEPLLQRKRVLEVGGHAETEGQSTLKLLDLGASVVSVWQTETVYEIDGVQIVDSLLDENHRPIWLDVAIVHGPEWLADEGFVAALKQTLGKRGVLCVLAPVDAWPYEDIVAALSPHFASMELHVETRASGRVFTPVGVEDPEVAVDGSLAAAESPVTYLFLCAEQPLGLTAQTVALLEAGETAVAAEEAVVDEEAFAEEEVLAAEAVEEGAVEEEALVAEAVEEEPHVEAPAGPTEAERDLEARLQDAILRLTEKSNAFALASEALETAEGRLEELQRTIRAFEPERERMNLLERENEEVLAQQDALRKAVFDAEAARREESEERQRAQRLVSELEVRLAMQRSEVSARDQRIKRLVEEVQRLEADLERGRDDIEASHQALVNERDARRETAARLQRDNDALRQEAGRVHALLARARDDLQSFAEQQQQGRALIQHLREDVETQTQRQKDANQALIAASQTVVARERQIEDLKAQLERSEEALRASQQNAEQHEAGLVEWSHKHAAMRAAKESVEAQLKGAMRSLQELRDQMEAHVASRLKLDADIEEYRQLVAAAEQEAKTLRHEHERVVLQAAEKQLVSDAAIAARDQAERDLAEARASLEGLRGHIEGVRGESSKKERELDSLRAEVMKRVDECEGLKAECSMLRSAVSEAEDRASFAEAREQELMTAKANLEQRAEEAMLSAKLNDAEREKWRQQHEELEARRVAEGEGRVTLERTLAAERERAQRLELDRDRLATERDRVSAERDRAAVERDRVTVDRDRLAAEVERARGAEAQKAELEKELTAARARFEAERTRSHDADKELVAAKARLEVLEKERAQAVRELENERQAVDDLRRELQKAATSSTTTPPASSSMDKSQEWQMLDSFHAESPDASEPKEWGEDDATQKTRVLK